jgi:hypothetical protein
MQNILFRCLPVGDNDFEVKSELVSVRDFMVNANKTEGIVQIHLEGNYESASICLMAEEGSSQ